MMNHGAMVEIESRQKLAKLKFPKELLKTQDKILGHYLREADTISEITAKVYAIDKVMEIEMHKPKKSKFRQK